jgi:hypothetical protein
MNETEESLLEEFEKPALGGAIAAMIDAMREHTVIFLVTGGTVVAVIVIRRRKRIIKAVRGLTVRNVEAKAQEAARIITTISHYF